VTEPNADPPRPPRRVNSGVVSELRSLPTLLLVLFCLFAGIPAMIMLTPSQDLTVAGQRLSVGARTPSPTVAGPAQLVQIGNTELDIARVRVIGPLRPQVMLGPIQRNAAAAAVLDPATRRQAQSQAIGTVRGGFLRWYLWATVAVLALTLTATATAACVRILTTLRRLSRAEHRHLTVADVWHRSVGQLRGMAVLAVAATMLAWLAAGGFAVAGTVRGLHNVRSLADLVGTHYLAPSPVGPPVAGFAGAVIGDSRASRVGGPPLPSPTEDDAACGRSTDSLAHEVGALVAAPVLNLACPSASIAAGLRGPQAQGGRVLPSQVGRLEQVEGLKFVVVVIGPNDLYWPDFLRYCYGVDNCSDRLTRGEFDYRLAAFDREYGDLLQDLNDLPGRPQVIVMTSYDVFKPDAGCADARGPAGAKGLNPDNIKLLASRNRELNDVLAAGAQKYGFDIASPVLTTLCQPSQDQLGADLQGLDGPNPFHPTGIGMVRLASAVVRVLQPLSQ
jgi:lysophospholipase L1-like esterase